MTDRLYVHPEPVPPASQLAVLPFIAAVDGYLREAGEVSGLRVTAHRAMSREGDGYLQQVCAYLTDAGGQSQGVVGRIFPVDTGIMGSAYRTGRIWRTRRFSEIAQLDAALRDEGDDPEKLRKSFFAMPFLGYQKEIVLILYAECNEFNFFADDERVKRIAAMGRGFCKLFDWLQRDPFENLRNFPLQKGIPFTGGAGVYKVQEQLDNPSPPAFTGVSSFNFEAAVA